MFKDDFVTKEQMEKYSNFLAERIDEMKKDVMTTGGCGYDGSGYSMSTGYTTSTSYDDCFPNTSSLINKLTKELKDSNDRIRQLEKRLNDFIDNPEKVKNQRTIDPYDEEDWNETK